jgi:hypothetical protein
LKKNYFSSHKLPKQQSTIFWSQGILGVNNHYSPICKVIQTYKKVGNCQYFCH